jgi:outer membrane protein OmpU
MKKVLLGTTALMGAGLVAGPAFAADGIKLGVGGFFRQTYMATFDDDGEGEAGNERNTHGFFGNQEIHFTGSTVLDNGLEVGARVELEGETAGDQIDESWIWFSGGFGEVRVGSEDDALANACIMPPGGTSNFSAFSPDNWGANQATDIVAAGGLTSNSACSGVDDQGDAQKIVYISPVFAGFQLNLSFTPNGDDQNHTDVGGPHNGMPFNEDAESRNNFSAYASYTYEGQDWGLTLGGGGSWEGHVEQQPGDDRDKQQIYQAGVGLTFGNFAIGGVFSYYNNGAGFSGFTDDDLDNDIWVAGAGIAYTMDAFTVGAQYSHQDADTEVSGGEDFDATLDRIVLTGNYAMGPGINLDASLGYTWLDGEDINNDDVDYDALEIGLGTAITF